VPPCVGAFIVPSEMKGKYGRFNKVKTRSPHAEGRAGGHSNACAMLLVMLATVLIPWGIYTTMHPRFSTDGGLHLNFGDINSAAHNMSSAFGHTVEAARASLDASMMSHGISLTQKVRMPVQGPVVTNGFNPLWGTKHQGGDAIFALAANYKIRYYQRFVSTLRDAGYTGDIVLAVTPLNKMAPGVAEYLKSQNVVAYPFEVQCLKKDNCKVCVSIMSYSVDKSSTFTPPRTPLSHTRARTHTYLHTTSSTTTCSDTQTRARTAPSPTSATRCTSTGSTTTNPRATFSSWTSETPSFRRTPSRGSATPWRRASPSSSCR